MTLTTVQGNLIQMALEGKFDAIAQSCNCFCNMGRGIAPQIAKAFPAAKAADDATVRGSREKLGSFSSACIQVADEKYVEVFNIYGQYGWKSEQVTYGTDHSALFRGLRAMRDYLDDCSYESPIKVGFPKIGSGLGGGDWGLISQMIEEVFSDTNRYSVIYVEYKE